jgi:hypothetical protein
MSIAELSKVVPPPKQPTEVGDMASWRNIEKNLGLVFPDDYREFVFTYGSGNLGRMFLIYNPFSSDEGGGAIGIGRIEWILGHVRRLRKEEGKKTIPYPVFPEPGGLFPFAKDENGWEYFWLTKGTANRWKMTCCAELSPPWEEHSYAMTTFFAKVLRNEFPDRSSSEKRSLYGGKLYTKHDLIFTPFDEEKRESKNNR